MKNETTQEIGLFSIGPSGVQLVGTSRERGLVDAVRKQILSDRRREISRIECDEMTPHSGNGRITEEAS